MKLTSTLASVVLVAVWASEGLGQKPPAPHGPMHHGPIPAPLLYVRFAGLPGMRVTFYTGEPAGREFPAPVTVGLRPGYIYRLKVTGFPDRPGVALYPTLEVRGTLQLPPQLRPADYPAPVIFSERDVDRAAAGAYLTKVVYVDHTDTPGVLPVPAPIETEVRPDLDLVEEARTVGRPLFILRFGGKDVSEQELAGCAIPGTILLPGEKGLAMPAAPPCVPWACVPLVDPRLGPRCLDEECLHDGGDIGQPAGLDNEGRLHGLDPSDTVAVYADSRGERHLAISNRVCLCVPRFGILRSELLPSGYVTVRGVGAAATTLARALVEMRVPSLETEQIAHPALLRIRERPSAAEASIGTAITAQLVSPATVLGRMKGAAVVGVAVPQVPPPPARPLVLCKTADRQGGQIGDVVTFTLRYTNTGGQPITDVVVSDSLAGRLEYVPGSAHSDRPAVFTLQDNEAGSVVLRWEIGGRLLGGESGVVSFQARIR